MFDFYKNELFENMEEIPVTAPIFEGYLYWYSDTNKWKWRQFRFDGTCLICLSTNKIKLPRNTPIEYIDSTHADISSLVTSPLLATPIHNSYHIPTSNSNNNNNGSSNIMAKYYQLPLFSVKLLQVTAITLIKINNKPSTCFCLHTDNNQRFLLKAKTQKDLDQWLFILIKAWNFNQAYNNNYGNTTKNNLISSEQQPYLPPSPSSPLVNNYSNNNNDNINNNNSLNNDIQYQNTLNHPPIPPPHQYQQQNNLSPLPKSNEYEEGYAISILSPEKEKWIDDWRKSLHLGDIYSSIHSSNKSSSSFHPLDLDLDDNNNHNHNNNTNNNNNNNNNSNNSNNNINNSLLLDSNSITHSQTDKKPSSMTIQLSDHHYPMKKKRSDEVKNWLSNKSLEHKDFDINFFQDATTTDNANDSSVNNSSEKDETKSSPLLHYHNSIRGKSIKIINQFQQQQLINDSNNDNKKNELKKSPSTPPLKYRSPLHTLSKSETPNDIYKQMDQMNLIKQQKNVKLRMDYYDSIDNNSNYNNNNNNSNNNISSSSLGLTPKDYFPHRMNGPSLVAPAIPPILKPTYTLVGSTASLSSTKKKINSNFLNPKLSDVFFPSRSSSSNIKQLYHNNKDNNNNNNKSSKLPPLPTSATSLPIHYQ
ncbi:unnamed protein product [Cunninghamella blakesleeana]